MPNLKGDVFKRIVNRINLGEKKAVQVSFKGCPSCEMVACLNISIDLRILLLK